MKNLLFILSLFLFLGCSEGNIGMIYQSDNLKIEKLTKNTYRHITYLQTEEYGLVACNGMIVVDKKEALIFDTATNDNDSKELIDFVEKELRAKVIGVVITHFHEDCLGGLQAFHDEGISSYASQKTIGFAEKDSLSTNPQIGFDNFLELEVGEMKVINEFLGGGHTEDNIICYVPSDKVLFGGCLIKRFGGAKGNLADANTTSWSQTVRTVKSKYGMAEIVIPGHGKPGDTGLLNYTEELFQVKY